MRFFSICTFFLMFSMFSTARANYINEGVVIVGNGGDVVYCKQTPGFSFLGYVPLDYVASYDTAIQLNTSFNRLLDIAFRLYPWLPDVANDLLIFESQMLTNRQNNKYIWQAAENGLLDIKDENLLSLLPKNCLLEDDTLQPHIIQAVVRKEISKNKILFQYDPRFLGPQADRFMLEQSFLFIHEWLWNYLSNSEVIRKVNNILNQERFDLKYGSKILNILENLGFKGLSDNDSSIRTLSVSVSTEGFYFEGSGVFSNKSLRKIKILNNTSESIKISNEITVAPKSISQPIDVTKINSLKVAGSHWNDYRLRYIDHSATITFAKRDGLWSYQLK